MRPLVWVAALCLLVQQPQPPTIIDARIDMATTDDALSVWPFPLPVAYGAGPGISSGLVIDAADEAAGFLFRAPRTGSIDAIGWATRTVTTGATVDVRLETVASGLPSGTLKGTNTNASQVVADGNDNVAFLTVLTAAASVTKGDKLAIVIKNPSASYGNMQIASFNEDSGGGYPFCASYTGGAWAKLVSNTGAPVMWVRYSDAPANVPIPMCWPIKDTITATSVGTGSTPDVIGARFQVSVGRRLRGAYVWADVDGDFNLRLVSTAYNQGAGTGILASAAFTSDDDSGTGAGIHYVEFPEAYVLAASTNYRLVVEPSSATTLSVYDFNVYDAATLGAYGGANFHLTTAKDPTGDGDWTNYNSGTFRVPFIWLVFDGIETSSGGGGFPVLGGSIVR